MQTLSEGWDQQAVDSANSILSNTTYSFLTWEDFFAEYFANNPFTDALRNYLGYPVFWWFSHEVHYNLQEGLTNPLSSAVQRIFQTYKGNLSETLSSLPELLQTLMNSLRIINNLVNFGVIDEISKERIFGFHRDLFETYPYLLKKSVTFNVGDEPYVSTVRAQVCANLRDALDLAPEVKNEIVETVNITGYYLNIWNDFSVLILDNNGFDTEQLSVIYSTLNEIPRFLHNLGIITQNDLLGNTGERHLWLATRSGVNIFNIKVGAMSENGFPGDVTPKYSDVFTLVLVHEINHVVDAFYISTDETRQNRKMDLIEAAGNVSLNYLRSMFSGDFFTRYPQEFFASISNQWFSDSFHTLELGLTRFSNGYLEPINQFLFFADIYSLGLNKTIFYTMDTEGHITKTLVPLTRDSNHHINSLDFNNTRFLFHLDPNGNVIDWETAPRHDSAVANVAPSKTVVNQNYSLNISATVENQGDFTETFNITLYANATIVQVLSVIDMPPANRTTVTFTWNTTGFAKGNYTMNLNATPILGETDTSDNNFTNGWIIISMIGDITGPDGYPDGKCDIRDVAMAAILFGVIYPDPRYNPNCDLTGPTLGVADGKIDIRDIATIAIHYGEVEP